MPRSNPAPTGSGMRWLRYELAWLATWRNLLLAALIAGTCCAIVFVVAYAVRPAAEIAPRAAKPDPKNIAKPPDGFPFNMVSPAAVRHKLIPPTAAVLARLPFSTEPFVYTVPASMKGEERQAYARKLEEMRNGPLGPWAQYNASGCRFFTTNASGEMIEPCPAVCVEEGDGWRHEVHFSNDGTQRTHMYYFTYKCGHVALDQPSELDMMYADGAAVAKEYASQVCEECRGQKRFKNPKGEITRRYDASGAGSAAAQADGGAGDG